MLFYLSIHYRLTGDRDQTCCKERSVISNLALNNPAARQFKDYWTFTGSQNPSPRSWLRFHRRLFVIPCRLGDNLPLPSRCQNKYSNSDFWPGSYLQIIFSIFNMTKKYFFVVFLNIFLGFLAVLLIQELRTVLEQD